ncbi:MAG: citrate synthase [Gammaproteobacteria bacterium]|nr:citrate synthase [Gammaproteobacteria bacterium]MDH3560406.1 citrate synthase [Gammaproteobacteria bacterium]
MSEFHPGLEGVPAKKSKISYLDGQQGILTYRGYPIVELAENSTFEETAYLLVDGELPTATQLAEFDAQLRVHRRVKYNIRDIMKSLPVAGHPMEMLQTSVSSLGMFYPSDVPVQIRSPGDESERYVHGQSIRILARMASLVAMWQQMRIGNDPTPPRSDLSYAANFLYMFQNGVEPDPLIARIMDVCLILHAEHTINASTFSAMVTGSTLAMPSYVIAAAIGTLAGALHGGANERVIQMLEEIGSPEAVPAWLDRKLAAKEVIWGMGHREYKVKDPRATLLQKLMLELAESRGSVSPLFETALALEEACEAILAPKGVYPNVDFYSGILYREMGIPPDQFTSIFAIARTAGWLAHWREQVSQNRIFRPTQIYTGHDPRAYVPISER